MAVRIVRLWPKVAHGDELHRCIWNSIGATKLFDAVLKVWDMKLDCRGYTPWLRILRRLYAEEIIKNHQKSKYIKKSPAMPTNQLTCTTNMILSHYRHRLWGLERRKVLNSILHCNWEIFISPGNSSVTRFNLFIQFLINLSAKVVTIGRLFFV